MGCGLMARRRVGASVLRGRGPGGRRGRRTYARDAHGRFAATAASPGGSADDDKRRTRRRTAAGLTVAVGVAAASQAHPASRTRTGITRRRIVRRHVGMARADHARQASRRNRVFPTEAVRSTRFDAKAARREGRTLTKGYQKQVRSVRKAARRSRH